MKSIRASSSGGVFTLLAKWVFERGGCICGAVMGPDMKTRYAIAESLEEI